MNLKTVEMGYKGQQVSYDTSLDIYEVLKVIGHDLKVTGSI